MNTIWKLVFEGHRHRHDGSSFQLRVNQSSPVRNIALTGPNGAGKSSLLAAILGFVPVEGEIKVHDQTLQSKSQSLHPYQRRMGWVDQSATLFPHLSVLENVAFGIRGDQKEAQALARLKQVGGEAWVSLKPEDLSGGQCQRVSIARALAIQPTALLLDEPLASLDAEHKQSIMSLLLSIAREEQLPWIWVTHDPSEALAVGEALWVMQEGSLAEGTFKDAAQQSIFEPDKEQGLVTRWRGEWIETEAGQGFVSFGQHKLSTTPQDIAPGASVICELDAEEIVLLTTPPPQTSARNVLTGTITQLAMHHDRVRCTVSTPELIDVLLTKQSVNTLELNVDKPVHLLFKVSAIKIRYHV